MKKSELLFSFLLLPLDFLMIILAGLSAYYLRFTSLATEIRPVIFNLPFGEYFKILLLIALAWLVIFALAGLYNIKGWRRLSDEIYRVVLACSTGLMLIVVLIFIFRELFSSRFIVLAGWLLAIVYIALARVMIRLIQRILLNYGIGVHKIVLVGDSKTTDILIHEFSSRQDLGYEIVKHLKNFSLESEEEMLEYLKTGEVDEVIQSDPNLSKAEVLRLFDFADANHLTFKYAADLLEAKVLKTEVSEIVGIPIVAVKKTPLDGWGRIIKRIFDLVVACCLLIFLGPVFILTMMIIKLDSRGPVIYKNERVLKDGLFKLLKFRSMICRYCVGDEYGKDEALEFERQLIEENNSKIGPVYKIANDPRLTRVGKFIRRWSIDELPQLFNVLLGQMSLVGPRPHQPREVEKYERRHAKVLTVKPGLTGLAQISGRSDLSFEDEVKLDSYYIENWSILLDLSILFRTPLAVFRKRKVE